MIHRWGASLLSEDVWKYNSIFQVIFPHSRENPVVAAGAFTVNILEEKELVYNKFFIQLSSRVMSDLFIEIHLLTSIHCEIRRMISFHGLKLRKKSTADTVYYSLSQNQYTTELILRKTYKTPPLKTIN